MLSMPWKKYGREIWNRERERDGVNPCPKKSRYDRSNCSSSHSHPFFLFWYILTLNNTSFDTLTLQASLFFTCPFHRLHSIYSIHHHLEHVSLHLKEKSVKIRNRRKNTKCLTHFQNFEHSNSSLVQETDGKSSSWWSSTKWRKDTKAPIWYRLSTINMIFVYKLTFMTNVCVQVHVTL